LLLQRFGSVARLKRTSVEQIASVEGISARLAVQIVQFLKERA
jgi:excinuclease UvrABC nuclease subunit